MTITMNHSRVNRDFFIKVRGLEEYDGKSTLRSSRKLEEILGKELHEKLVNKAYAKGLDRVICKLRRGLTIDFYTK